MKNGICGMLAAMMLMAATPAVAQNAAAPNEWAIEFIGRAARNYDEAFQAFKAETYLGQTVAPVTETMRDAFRKNVNAYGPVQTYEVVAEHAIGDRLRRVHILAYHPKGIQFFTMDFYRQTPTDGWYLHGMKIDVSVQGLPWPPVPAPAAATAGVKPR
ncbi:hypothetical protein [Ferrovibrio terrae]|uniref:hypothetical protein n=1 Tax=Ferrovibrio terrae TaxID=2594003 RepID=UPI003137D011